MIDVFECIDSGEAIMKGLKSDEKIYKAFNCTFSEMALYHCKWLNYSYGSSWEKKAFRMPIVSLQRLGTATYLKYNGFMSHELATSSGLQKMCENYADELIPDKKEERKNEMVSTILAYCFKEQKFTDYETERNQIILTASKISELHHKIHRELIEPIDRILNKDRNMHPIDSWENIKKHIARIVEHFLISVE